MSATCAFITVLACLLILALFVFAIFWELDGSGSDRDRCECCGQSVPWDAEECPWCRADLIPYGR